MANVLILFSLTLGQLIVALLFARSRELYEYVAFVVAFADSKLDAQFIALLIFHVASYAILTFLLLCTVQSIASWRPSATAPVAIRLLDKLLRVVIVLTPSGVLAYLTAKAIDRFGWNWLLVLIALVLSAGIMCMLVVELRRIEFPLFRSTLRPPRLTAQDKAFGASVVLALIAYLCMRVWIVEISHLLGLFSIFFIAYSLLLILLNLLLNLGHRVPVTAAAVAAILVLQIIDGYLPVRQFRHSSFLSAMVL